VGLEQVVRKSEKSFDFIKFSQSLEQFKDYNDEMYQMLKGNITGGSSAHAELQKEFLLCGPDFL